MTDEYDSTLSVQENLARAIFALARAVEKYGEVESPDSAHAVHIKRVPRLPREEVSASDIRVGDRLFRTGSGYNESFTVTKVEFCPHVGGGIQGQDDTDGHTVSWGLGANSTVERRI